MNKQVPLRLRLPIEATFPGLVLPPAPADALCTPAAPLDMQELVDAPCRTLETEFKAWRNLDNAEDQAELARDIAAIANSGGGHIVFGFNEATLARVDTEPFGTVCTGDRVWRSCAPGWIAAVVRGAPDPLGVGGPASSDPRGRPRRHPGVRAARRSGAYRRASGRARCRLYPSGPAVRGMPVPPQAETGRAECAQDWAPLIRRCVRNDRETLRG